MRLFVVAGGLCILAACAQPPPLVDPTFDSPESLARAVLDRFAAGDTEGLRRLAVTEQEFRQRVWPELPASRPERNLPFSYVWGDLSQKSGQSLQQLLAKHTGRAYTLASVRFGATTPYETFTVHRDSVFVVRGAEEPEVRLCGSMIEAAGRWKVFSYVVDD